MPLAKIYNSNPDKVITFFTGTNSATSKVEKIVQSKNLVLLTCVPLGTKYQATFLHSTVDITSDAVHHVAYSGMKYETGVEIHPNSLFSVTSARYVPSFLEMMKVKSEKDSTDLVAPTSRPKKKVHCYVVLAPSLAEAIQPTNLTPTAICLSLIEQIKVLGPSSPTASSILVLIVGTTPLPGPPPAASGSSSSATTQVSTEAGTATSTPTPPPIGVETTTPILTADQVMRKMTELYGQVLCLCGERINLKQR